MIKNESKLEGVIIGIDASRNRSGGAKAHLLGILTEGDPIQYGIAEVHVWAFQSLINSMPERPWLVKHNPIELNKKLPNQLWWQGRKLAEKAKSLRCDILFTTDASSVCRFQPMIVLSQDMLSYEPGVMKYFGYSKARFRLLAILFLQNRALRFADGVIFLTHYAGKVIQQSCGKLSRVAYIPHGIGEDFKKAKARQVWNGKSMRAIRCLYVSNTAMYKHQWVVVEAVSYLRKIGYNITLTLVGGGAGRAQQLLNKQLSISDPGGTFVEQLDFVPQKELPALLTNADIFVFASSCENMPITLVEAMAMGLPIACSNRGPMPEVLDDGGVYFDPEKADSIANAIEQIITNESLRIRLAEQAEILSNQYSWKRCAEDTWQFIVETYRSIKR